MSQQKDSALVLYRYLLIVFNILNNDPEVFIIR
ncbi:MAG: hypothetical protein ACI974_001108, partial [Paraglaciecola sp.]